MNTVKIWQSAETDARDGTHNTGTDGEAMDIFVREYLAMD